MGNNIVRFTLKKHSKTTKEIPEIKFKLNELSVTVWNIYEKTQESSSGWISNICGHSKEHANINEMLSSTSKYTDMILTVCPPLHPRCTASHLSTLLGHREYLHCDR